MMFAAHDIGQAAPWRSPAPCAPLLGERRTAEIVLDLSRLLSRALHPSPTGVDRVEMAYARALARLAPERLRFAAVHPTGLYGRLPAARVAAFLDRTEARWERIGVHESAQVAHRIALAHCWQLRPRPIPPPTGPRVLLQVSPHHLDRPWIVARKLRRERARFVCLVHDLIPLSHPEYARPGSDARHAERLRTIERFADGILTNSRATLDALARRAGPALCTLPSRVAHLGVDITVSPPGSATSGPQGVYFVSLATIEPRKNHLLLLHIWRSIVEAIGTEQAPRLLLIGRRGWENENILDMLERCPGLKGVVHELPRLPDVELRGLLAGARALLMPSFVEGFGLPVAEALAAGVPVLASDIPAHREAGGMVPDYLDPIDGAAWRSAVLDYSAPASTRRAAQIERLARWRPVSWEQHVEAALALIEEVSAC